MTGPSKKVSISILGASFNTSNLGVGALAAGTLTAICHHYPDAEMAILDYGKENTSIRFCLQGKAIPVKRINLRFSKKFYLPNNIALLLLVSLALRLLPGRLRSRLAARNATLMHLYKSDLVVAISGGDSFSDIYGLGRFVYVALPQLLAIFCRRPLILLPQTLGPFKGKPARMIARYILDRAEVVYSRDREGLSYGERRPQNGNGTARFRFCYDMGFVLEPRRPAGLKEDEAGGGLSQPGEHGHPLVGLNVSGLLASGGYTRQNMFGLRADYNVLVRKLVEFFIEQGGATVALVPHVFGTHSGNESDADACAGIYRTLRPVYGDRIRLVQGDYDQNEIKYIIGRCDFFVGSRMHACIAALSQGIPALAIAYSDKFIGVLRTLGIDSLVADARQLDEQGIIRAVSDAYDHRLSIQQRLHQKMAGVRQTVLQLFADIEAAPKAV